MLTNKNILSYTPMSLTVDGTPFYPVMGEMHFSRYRNRYWEEELCKMKSGGVSIVSLYTIWIHHEEIRGEFDFSGDRNLRKFLQTVKRVGLNCILRIGPWAHGEARNGGFPDWLLEDAKEKGYEVRSNAPEYLQHARIFYEHIYEQAEGLFLKDGGPIIGVQIENEYGHCGGFGGEEGEAHMRTLCDMAKEIGFDVPIYTATGWGGAVTGGMLPVMGGYCEAPWDQRTTEIEPSGNYIFTRERNDHNIGSDHGIGAGITFDMDKFPYLTAELGGGLQVTHHRRCIATGRDTEAMSLVKMGSGANLLGYYMYHGGTNPEGKLTTLQESRETGYPNDLPVLSYDFNAPLKEYGQMSETYRRIRRLAMFTRDFGEGLCEMPYIPQPGNPDMPDNMTDLRTAVRGAIKDVNGKEMFSGYLFVNNYVRRCNMADHDKEILKAYDPDGNIVAEFEERNIKNGDYFFYPFNMQIGEDAVLKRANMTPLCILHDEKGRENAYVFYTDDRDSAAFEIEGDLGLISIVILSDYEAENAVKIKDDRGAEHLVICEHAVVDRIVPTNRRRSGVLENGNPNGYEIYAEIPSDGAGHTVSFRVWPDLDETPIGFIHADAENVSDTYMVDSMDFADYRYVDELTNPVETKLTEGVVAGEYQISVTNIDEDIDEVYLHVHYAGDRGELLSCGDLDAIHDGELIADSFYTGQDWEIGLKRFIGSETAESLEESFEAKAVIYPLFEDQKIYLQEWPDLSEESDGKAAACRIEGVDSVAQYKIKIW
ncbi:beta-galactosidase [Butyrivibrio sp. LC3010]|uniref:beta-galactosidase n=1 Tax=Butyrivibrio sp. LC3010 TaxID=1280680 RepID=UPI0003FBAF10|nr:beta-galactosidase [Butyrivibrio sp. LC3010]